MGYTEKQAVTGFPDAAAAERSFTPGPEPYSRLSGNS